MLKALVQLFAEKFLQSKKSWVSEQSAPIIHQGINIPCTSTTDFFSYIAPCNGWVFVTCGNFIKSAMLKNNRSGISVRLENGESDKNYLQWPHLILPCVKGDSWQVVIYTKTGQTEGTAIRFIPSIGG